MIIDWSHTQSFFGGGGVLINWNESVARTFTKMQLDMAGKRAGVAFTGKRSSMTGAGKRANLDMEKVDC